MENILELGDKFDIALSSFADMVKLLRIGADRGTGELSEYVLLINALRHIDDETEKLIACYDNILTTIDETNNK